MDYRNITTIEQLKKAQVEIKYKIEAKERELAGNYATLKSCLNPLTYIRKVALKLYSLRHLGYYITAFYNYIKELFSKSGKESDRQSGAKGVVEAESVTAAEEA